jgi:TetR/AcrR family transcriptional regulator
VRRFRRARRPEEKELRRETILAAARQLANEVGAVNLGLNELGRKSKISKPNIYRYFESREDVLLQLFVTELGSYVDELENQLQSNQQIAQVAKVIAAGYLTRPLLCQLLAIVNNVLEENVSSESITKAKTTILQLSGRVGTVMNTSLPWLSPQDGAWCAHTIALYTAGLWPAANPSAVAASVLEQSEFAGMKPHAQRDLNRFANVLLLGMQRESGPMPRTQRRQRSRVSLRQKT